MDIELDDNEWIDVDVAYKERIVHSSEIEDAKQRLLKEAEEAEQKAQAEEAEQKAQAEEAEQKAQAEEAEQKAQAEAFEIERQKIIAELKKNHKQFLVDEDEEEEDPEGSDCSSLQTETSDEEDKDFQDEAEKKALIKNSKCRRAVYWLNKIVRPNHETKIKKTFVNEEKKGDQLVIKGNLDRGMTCAMFEQKKRATLLMAMEERKEVEEEWLRSQREKSQKKQAKSQQKMEQSNTQPYPKQVRFSGFDLLLNTYESFEHFIYYYKVDPLEGCKLTARIGQHEGKCSTEMSEVVKWVKVYLKPMYSSFFVH
jgi:hypothetical protein